MIILMDETNRMEAAAVYAASWRASHKKSAAKGLYERCGFVFSGEERVLNSEIGLTERKYIYKPTDTVEF